MRINNLSKIAVSSALTAFISLLTIHTSFAQHNIGDVVDYTVDTDIVTYINNNPIPSYSVDGETLVRLEDLQYYGFDISFNNNIASAVYDENKTVNPIYKKAKSGLSVLYSDITVHINDITVPGYNIEGYMAVPVERACETYLQTNAENIYSEYSMNYLWIPDRRSLKIDIASDRITYQDLLLDFLRAAKMDFGSNFHKHYVEPDETALKENLTTKISDISGTKLEKYAFLLAKVDMIDISEYDNTPIHPYRGSTMTDAAFLISRILGCPVDYTDAFDYFRDTRINLRFSEDNTADLNDYSDYNIESSDAALIPVWARGYFAYLLDIGVFNADSSGCLHPNAFLTKDLEAQLINDMLAYMERGITDMDINFILYSNSSYPEPITVSPHKLTSPAQIVDNVLYVPCYSLFNESYGEDIINASEYKYETSYCGAYKFVPSDNNVHIPTMGSSGHTHIFTNHYVYTGDGGLFFNIFPGITEYVKHVEWRSTGGIAVPNYRKVDYPILKLYGEPMMPVYDYSANQKVYPRHLFHKFDFNPDSNTITFAYDEYNPGAV